MQLSKNQISVQGLAHLFHILKIIPGITVPPFWRPVSQNPLKPPGVHFLLDHICTSKAISIVRLAAYATTGRLKCEVGRILL